jgi:hypothetical protein
MHYHVYRVEIDGVEKHCLSILSKETVVAKSLHTQAIVGFLKTEKVDSKEFSESQAFKEFFNQVIVRHLPTLTEFLNEGKKIGTGYVYLIDKRTKNPKADVPMEDIIGAVNFENGKLVPDSFIPNRSYKLLTQKGLFQLPYLLEETFLKEIGT